jgi:N-acetylglucosaminyldiphosphoundecaprenol N-acetyl-beta-D-mannosaminyltransferase
LLERIAGADLVPLLLRVAAEKGYRVFFLGATPDSVARAVENLTNRHPNLVIAGYYSPPFNKLLEMDHEEIERRILKAKPDLLFVSLGCPKQEKWIAMHYRSLGVPVSAGVGATIDFLAGAVKRAPAWMQRIGAEWVYRLMQEPRRLFKRYATDLVVFGWKIFLQLWQLRFRSRKPQLSREGSHAEEDHDCQLIKVPDWFDLAAVRDVAALAEDVHSDGRHCLVEMSNVKFIDSTGVGFLIHLQKKIRGDGCQLVLVGPSPAAQRALKLMRLQNFFAATRDVKAAQALIRARTGEEFSAVRIPGAADWKPLLWQGEITAVNAEAVGRTTEAQICSKRRAELVIDLSGVRFMDSSGLGLMVRARKLAQREGVRLMFVNPQPAVENVVHLARLQEFLFA